MSDRPSDVPGILRALQEALKKQFGVHANRVDVWFDTDPRPLSLPVPRCECPPSPARPDPGPDLRLSEMEETILEAIGDETLTAQQIAERAGYPYDSHLKTVLAAMRRRGLLSGGHGAPGYRSTLT